MSLGGRVTAPELANKMVDIFLSTDYEGGRHQKRLEQFTDYDPALTISNS